MDQKTIELIVLIIVLVAILAYGILTGKVLIWLRCIVTEVEKDLGSGTGKLKLVKAYDEFIARFPIFSSFVPFKLFEVLVDSALKWMRQVLERNDKIANYVGDNEK